MVPSLLDNLSDQDPPRGQDLLLPAALHGQGKGQAVLCVLRGEEDTIIQRRKVEKQAVYRALSLLSMGILIVAASTLAILLAMGGRFDAIDVVFEDLQLGHHPVQFGQQLPGVLGGGFPLLDLGVVVETGVELGGPLLQIPPQGQRFV